MVGDAGHMLVQSALDPRCSDANAATRGIQDEVLGLDHACVHIVTTLNGAYAASGFSSTQNDTGIKTKGAAMSIELHELKVEVTVPQNLLTQTRRTARRVHFCVEPPRRRSGSRAAAHRSGRRDYCATHLAEVTIKTEELAEIHVTGTRIVGGGYDAPNPVTTVSAVRLEDLAITNIGDALNRLPQFRATQTPQTTEDGAPTNLGARVADLRGLGANRTLVLVDGRRFVPSNSQGTVDLNNIPVNMIDRVEVVTGGASALYGADAVAGVVNLILDKKFNGLDVEASYGRSQAGDMDTVYLSLKGGTNFAGDKGHVLVGAEFENNDGTGGCDSRDWCMQNTNILANPTPGVNGMPANLRLSNLFAVNSANGLIISGALSGTTFTPSGSPTPFNYGKLPGFVFMQGGDSDNGKQLWLEGALVSSPFQRENVFLHSDYDFTDTIQGFSDLSYSRVKANSNQIPPVEFPTAISVNNPYIPASILPALLADGETSFEFKRQNNDFGQLLAKSDDKTMRAAVGVKGTIGETWHWDAYYQYGRHTNDSQIGNNRNNANWFQAVDAVLAPNGQIVCASSLTDPTNGCHPVNLFGANQSIRRRSRMSTVRRGRPGYWKRMSPQPISAARRSRIGRARCLSPAAWNFGTTRPMAPSIPFRLPWDGGTIRPLRSQAR